MSTYTNRASFSSRPNFKLDIEAVVSGTTVTMRAYAVRTGSETTTPFANSGSGSSRTYNFGGNSSSPSSGSADWVFDFRPAGSSSSSNPYTVGVWSSGITRTLSASSTITVTASMSLLGSASVSVFVPIVTTPAPSFSGSFASGTAGSFYSSSVTVSDASSVSISSGSLPSGLSGSFSGSTYTVSGTPSTAGTSNFTLSASGGGGTTNQSYSISIAQPAPAPPSWSSNFPAATIGVGYSGSASVFSSSFVTWGFNTAPSIPGLSLSYNGTTGFTLSGTPTTVGTYSFSATATDDFGQSTFQSFSISVTQPVPVISANIPNSGTVNVFYSGSASATNSPSSWSLGGTLPPGVSGSASGSNYSISGTPTTAGTYNFSLTASNSGGSDTESFSITVSAPANPTWSSTANFANGKVGTAYYHTRTASNATSITNASTTAPGLSASASGSSTLVVSGTPSAAGTYTVSATANGQSGTSPANLNVSIVIAPTTPPVWVDQTVSTNFVVGTAYSDGVSATNATSYAVASGALPAGISLNSSNGSITGTPTTKQFFNFSLQATNLDGTITSAIFSGTTSAPPVWIDQTLAGFSQGRAYSDGVSATSPISSSPTVYAVASGSLPAGISLNTSTGTVTGTPTGTGNFSFSISATNSDGTISASFSGAILLPPNWIDNELGSFVETVLYSDSVVATNSPTYSVITGALPTGITLNSSTGLVSGTPTTVGQVFSFTIRAQNADGSVTQAFSGTVQPDLGGGIKLYDGTGWSNKEIYAYDGEAWVQGRVYRYNGNIWVKSLF